jgi:NAD(P)-dependent dehydrogenase (short-subunit alcohol dehydrogenase family)
MKVLVTGGSRGIGRAIVHRLAAAGHEVCAASRHPDPAGLPGGVLPLELDVTSAAAAHAAMEAVSAQWGGLDALVNNAGAGLLAPLEETSDDEAHHVFEVNFFGPLRLARLAIPLLRARGTGGGGGRIVNVTSMNDVMAAPFGGYYSASKAALASASAVLGAEVAPFGIRVSVVAPGLFRTDMARNLGEVAVDPASPYAAAMTTLRSQDRGRLESAGDPDEVAQAVERCLTSEDPPARVVVGADAEGFERLVRGASVEEFAAMLRDYVSQLMGADSSLA